MILLLGISSWIKDIITLIIFATFIDLLLPQSSMQRFIRVIIGLLIMLAVINPLIDVFQNNRLSQLPIMNAEPQTRSVALGNPDEIKNAKNEIIREKYKKELAKQLKATVVAAEGVADARVIVELEQTKDMDLGKIQKITIYLLPDSYRGNSAPATSRGGDGNSKEITLQIENKVKQLIVGIYGISTEKIAVEKWI